MDSFTSMIVSIAAPAITFAFLGAIILVPMVLRHRQRQTLLEFAKAAASRGEPLSPELLDRLSVERPRPARSVTESDLRTGGLLLAVAAAMVVFSVVFVAIEGDHEAYAIAGLAAFPGLIGLTKLLFGAIGLRKRAA